MATKKKPAPLAPRAAAATGDDAAAPPPAAPPTVPFAQPPRPGEQCRETAGCRGKYTVFSTRISSAGRLQYFHCAVCQQPSPAYKRGIPTAFINVGAKKEDKTE